MKEVLQVWNLQTMVDNNMSIVLGAVSGLLFAFYAFRILSEIYSTLLSQDGRFSLTQLTPIVIIFGALICYKEIVFLIGDAFIYLADAIRGGTAEKYKFTSVIDSLQNSYHDTSPTDYSFYGFLKWVWSSTTDWALDFLSIPFQLMASILALILRFCAVWFTQVVFCLMIIIGPVPLALSLLPGFQGFAAHWFKNFITVCCWNVTIAILDMLVTTLNVTYLVQYVFNGNQEFAIAMINFITSACYLFVPKLTSLMIGQTAVAGIGALPAAMAKTAVGLATKGAAMKAGASKMAAASSAASAGDSRTASTGNMAGARYAGGALNNTTPRQHSSSTQKTKQL
jgi:hypothetical protein